MYLARRSTTEHVLTPSLKTSSQDADLEAVGYALEPRICKPLGAYPNLRIGRFLDAPRLKIHVGWQNLFPPKRRKKNVQYALTAVQ